MEDKKDIISRSLKLTPEESRPREKAMRYRFDHLTVAELMAIIIGSGSQGESVVDLCERILLNNNNKLYNLARQSVKNLTAYKGIGQVKAIELLAALEIARRYQLEEFQESPQIKTISDAYNYIKSALRDLSHEEIWIIILNHSKHAIDRVRISSGGMTSTVGDIKIILREALERRATGIILAHNHPSDNPTPSRADDNLTERVKAGCRAVDIEFVDHIIVCRGKYYSYVEQGRI